VPLSAVTPNLLPKVIIGPYLASFAAVGLAQATRVTGDRSYVAAAWRWLDWYAAHQDAQGYVQDYDVVNGAAVSTGTADSTDSYAGMFLVTTRAALVVSGDVAHLARLAPSVRLAVSAIESTQDQDGLTWAKPSWHGFSGTDIPGVPGAVSWVFPFSRCQRGASGVAAGCLPRVSGRVGAVAGHLEFDAAALGEGR
jgi:hypothetical protein